MRKRHEVEISGKKINEPDNKLLRYIQNILFTELAVSLNTTFEVIYEKIISFISENAD